MQALQDGPNLHVARRPQAANIEYTRRILNETFSFCIFLRLLVRGAIAYVQLMAHAHECPDNLPGCNYPSSVWNHQGRTSAP